MHTHKETLNNRISKEKGPTPNKGLFWLILLTLLIVGCGGDDFSELVAVTPTSRPATRRPTITPGPTRTPSATPIPTVPTATPRPSATPTPIKNDEEIKFESFQFDYPAALVRNISPRFNQPLGNMIPFAQSNSISTEFSGVPDLLVFDMPLFGSGNRRGQMIVVEYADQEENFYDAFSADDQKTILTLQARLQEAQDQTARSLQVPEGFLAYLELEQGKALRSIQYLPPTNEFDPVGQGNLFYVAEGILGSRFYFNFRFPIALRDYPDGIPIDEDSIVVKSTIDGVLANLEAEPNLAILPDLDLLDEMMTSVIHNDLPGLRPTAQPSPTLEEPTPEATEGGQTATMTPSPSSTPTMTPSPTATPSPPPTATGTATPAPTQTPVSTATTPPPTLRPTATVPSAVIPVPTNEPDCAHFLVFLDDVTVPDGTTFPPGAQLLKIWRVQNAGTCHLSDSYRLFPIQESIEVVRINPIPPILAGEVGELSVVLRAPSEPGRYLMNWQIAPPTDGTVDATDPFGQLFIEIAVDPAAPSPTPFPSGFGSSGMADPTGEWTIDRFVRSSGAELSSSEAAQLVSEVVAIESTQISFDGESCQNIVLNPEPTTAGDFLPGAFGVTAGTLGLSEMQNILVYQTTCDIEGFESFFLIENTPSELVIQKEGVFFFLRK